MKFIRVSLVAQTVKNRPAMWETWVWSLGWEDPLEEGWQPTLVFLPGGSPWTEEPDGLRSMGSQRVWQTERLSTAQHIYIYVSFLSLKKMFTEPWIYHSEQSRSYNYYILSKSAILRNGQMLLCARWQHHQLQVRRLTKLPRGDSLKLRPSEGMRECLRGKRWVSSKQREAWVRGITIQEPKAVHPARQRVQRGGHSAR